MPVGNNFSEAMSNRTIEELIRMITVDRGTYQAPAIEAAEDELRKRTIDAGKIEELKSAYVREAKDKNHINANRSGLGLRFIHYIVDTTAWMVITIILAFVMNPFVRNLESDLLFFLFPVITWFGYYVFFEATYQKTPGKFLTASKVVMKDGRQPTIGEIFIRTFGRLIPFDNVSFFFMSDGGTHDYISGTTVVKSNFGKEAGHAEKELTISR